MKLNRIISLFIIFALVLAMANMVTADNVLSRDQLRLGDVTGDGAINAADALEILQFSVNKRDLFSAEEQSVSQSEPTSDAADESQESPCLREDIPTFKTEKELNAWLVSEEARKYFPDETYRSLAPDHSVVYDRPATLEKLPYMDLFHITVDDSGLMYWLEFDDVTVTKNTSNNYFSVSFDDYLVNKFLSEIEAKIKAGFYEVLSCNGTTYYYNRTDCSITDENNSTIPYCRVNIVWIQNDRFCAFHYNTLETKYEVDAEEWLPYLTLETVTLPLDTVA